MSTYHVAPSVDKTLGATSRIEITSLDGRWHLFGNAKVIEQVWEPDVEDIITKKWSSYGPSTVKFTLQMVPDERGVAYTLRDKRHGVEVPVSKHFPVETN